MEIIEHKNEIELLGIEDFDPQLIFECGQCFRWNPDENGDYVGVAKGKAAKVHLKDSDIFISGSLNEFREIWADYFDIYRDYAAIREMVSVDKYMTEAAAYGRGIRILRQDKWEAMCSFIISQCNNIKRIKGIIDRFCAAFGDPIEFMGNTMYTFPSAERVAKLSVEDLEVLRAGYRAPYIIDAARKVTENPDLLTQIAEMPEKDMLKALKTFNGIGNKVANCIMLFGLNRLDAFPEDVWIKRVIKGQYGNDFDKSVFGEYAGIAQQYMFHYARTGGSNI